MRLHLIGVNPWREDSCNSDTTSILLNCHMSRPKMLDAVGPKNSKSWIHHGKIGATLPNMTLEQASGSA